MKLTPLDIQQVGFKVRLRGYDRREVDAFLDSVTEEFELLARTNTELRERLAQMEIQLVEFKKKEASLNNTLIKAQELVEEMRLSSQKEGQLVVREAELRAEEIIKTARDEVVDCRRDLLDLQKQKAVATEKIRSIVLAVQRLLDVEDREGEPLLGDRPVLDRETQRAYKPKP